MISDYEENNISHTFQTLYFVGFDLKVKWKFGRNSVETEQLEGTFHIQI